MKKDRVAIGLWMQEDGLSNNNCFRVTRVEKCVNNKLSKPRKASK